MKKLNRVLSLIIVLALAISVFALPASAVSAVNEDETQKQTSGEQAGGDDAAGGTESSDTTETKAVTSLPVYKNLVTKVKNVALPQETFSFQMVPATDLTGDEKYGSVKVQAGYALKNNAVDLTFGAGDTISPYIKDGKATGEGIVTKSDEFKFEFVDADGKDITFTNTGIYRYYIKEVIKNVGSDGTVSYEALPEQDPAKTYYVTYDTTVYVVDLVVNVVDGSYGVTNVLVTKQGDTSENKDKPEKVAFTNTIDCSNIKISKLISNDTVEYTNDEEYTFYILIPVKGDSITLTATDTIQAQKYEADGTAVGEPFTLEVKGEDITSDVVENGTKFTLKAGQYIMITAPVSMIFKVAEVIPTEEGYTISATYNESGTYKDSTTVNSTVDELSESKTYTDATTNKEMTEFAVKGTTNTNTTQVEFVNTRETGTLTGVNIDFVPYAIIALMAVIGCAVLIVKKSRKVH
jgi:hypothetical protein